ncbi:DgyrCDS7067 [Dimorphilus gyrociliatus]|uniref:Tetratricopeptide repeat protein 38 n=1 Tax=Dimorphilus gyrociliatus TaxID=2664684 RepID=A0A7I8VUW5_9ANNE|nr:DgyrCDS7067 [Dimorphilus gyrociliatus]
MSLHTNWRDCKELKEHFPISTTSNEAAKLFDAVVTQYVGWYNDPSVGGLDNCLDKLLSADEVFPMSHVLLNGLEIMSTGSHPKYNENLRKSLLLMNETVGGKTLNNWEERHIKAINQCASGSMKTACDIWDDILIDYPNDILALKFAHDSYFYLGYQRKMRDSVARVFPSWNKSIPLYGYLHGMLAFGLCETNLYADAEKSAKTALSINSKDAWATHALAHVLEMTGRQIEGISFMSSTVTDWSFCGMLSCHNFWHWAVYHIEKGEYQAALDIYDSAVGTASIKSGTMLDIVDACSLLYRLELEGQKVGKRWEELFETCYKHYGDHTLAFNDSHLFMCYSANKEKDVAKDFLTSLQNFLTENPEDYQGKCIRKVGLNVCKAIDSFDNGNFEDAVNFLLPIRYDIIKIGGSNAQRDVFNLLLINSALKSENVHHRLMARYGAIVFGLDSV